MKTQISTILGTAQDMKAISSQSVDLVVTSPPYPMIEMWDDIFIRQDSRIREKLGLGQGKEAFELMHCILDAAWQECDRVLKPGGIACVNIGDATRTMDGDFQLYSNHSRIISNFLKRGYATLPDILWRKQTNAPNKFMGSGMLPVGAYVTYEHEYILVLRKGLRRRFIEPQEKKHRQGSAFFWEERNVWFSDLWSDIKGVSQALVEKETRDRSAAFPFEVAYRLICMFSIKGDVVLDPFSGTGTTLVAALASGRNALGVDFDPPLVAAAHRLLSGAQNYVNSYTRDRLSRHIDFVSKRTTDIGPLKHVNSHYGFPVMTAQEKDLLMNDVITINEENDQSLSVLLDDGPQADWVRDWTSTELVDGQIPESTSKTSNRSKSRSLSMNLAQEEMKFHKS